MQKFLAVIPGILAVFASLPSIAADTWTTLQAMPTARSEISVTLLDDTLFVAGGINLSGTVNTFEGYGLASNDWQQYASLPKALHHVALATLNGKVYASGGYTSLRFTPNDPQLFAYNPATNSWQEKARMPGPRGEHTMLAIEGKLLIFGGRQDTSRQIWVYDPDTDSWATDVYPDMPTYRHSATAIHVPNDRAVYVIGGRYEDGRAKLTMERLDLVKKSWEQLPDMPVARGGHGAALIGRNIHIWGGEILDEGRVLDSHLIYNLDTQVWSEGPSLLVPRHGVAAIGHENQGYLLGGGLKAGFRTLWSATDRLDRFTAD